MKRNTTLEEAAKTPTQKAYQECSAQETKEKGLCIEMVGSLLQRRKPHDSICPMRPYK